ncbi:glycosyltransferase [Bifidobacterium saguinibicoloris]|uniref:glycosyltransferase n=1 Tax=Bifidobacterium saguinibicoloris TaxID=2834433 RepID=UPI001F15AB72|nr:glycosyltransferase [Bifidobacterium saguinibicoloris]
MTETVQPFCVLMSVYQGETLAHLQRAVASATVEQTLPPEQCVIVRDGPVPQDMQRYLDDLEDDDSARHITRFTIVPLEHNDGLAHALNVGLAHCDHELVARADSDDISLPDRFATQLPLFRSGAIDVAGSAIREFSGDETHLGQVRTLPAGGPELARYARLQSPLHHPSVVFRKSAVLAAGGYPEHAGRFEDYLLWERMLLRGARMRNVGAPLVLYRVDAGAYERRGGRDMFREEVRLQRRFLADGFVTRTQFLRNVTVRAVYRLVPTRARRAAYRALTALRNRGRR